MLMNRKTKCCSAPVVRHSKLEYPVDKVYTISTSWDACSKCYDEWPDTVEEVEEDV